MGRNDNRFDESKIRRTPPGRTGAGQFAPKQAPDAVIPPDGALTLGPGGSGDHADALTAFSNDRRSKPPRQRIPTRGAFDRAKSDAAGLPTYECHDHSDDPAAFWGRELCADEWGISAGSETDSINTIVKNGWVYTYGELVSGYAEADLDAVSEQMERKRRMSRSSSQAATGAYDYSHDPEVRAELCYETALETADRLQEIHSAVFAEYVSRQPEAVAALGTDDPYEIHCKIAGHIDSGRYTQWARNPDNTTVGEARQWLEFCAASEAVATAAMEDVL